MIGRVSRRRRGAVKLVEVVLFLIVVALLAAAAGFQDKRFKNRTFKADIYQQRVTLPSSDTLRMLTLGYTNIYADWLWLQSIQAFGSGWQTMDKVNPTKPIYEYFDTLTDMDPHFISAYRFANLVIEDQRGDAVRGRDILRKGSFHNPSNYDIPYLGVYNAVWGYKDMPTARWFARRLTRIQSAPTFMKRMEEYIERESGRFELAFKINVRFMVEYVASGNDIERDIVARRTQKLLNDWYRKGFKDAVERYVEANGEHPKEMEQLLDPKYTPDYPGATLPSFKRAMDSHASEIEAIGKQGKVPEKLVDDITRESTEVIKGLPPEPYGTWYFIDPLSRDLYLEKTEHNDGEDAPAYIVSAQDFIQVLNEVAMSAQMKILDFYGKNKIKPGDPVVAEFLLKDYLGGHYVYDRNDPASPEYGTFYSTAGRRITDRKEPRLGIFGRGPFPFPLRPSLSERPDEKEWGIKNGWILPDGTELDKPPKKDGGQFVTVEPPE